jgi:methylated-DNA-[protein]-cysteine S-methyltransferase
MILAVPLNLFLSRVNTPLGQMFLVCDSQSRVYAFEFEGHTDLMPRLLRMHGKPPSGAHRLTPAPAPRDIETDSGGTSFQRQVWSALREIPPATTVSYGQLAARIGKPHARRAVGAANGSNPIAIIVPCHRVIGSGGKLTGYGGGIDRKRWLLDHESGRPKLFPSP